jgi:DMSO reductase anchor subunit
MWRRSWLSREVLLFTLFFGALAAAAVAAVALQYGLGIPHWLPVALGLGAAILGVLGTLASAAIYLVQARPAWNTPHTPIDFVFTAALLGSLLSAALARTTPAVPLPAVLGFLGSVSSPTANAFACIAVCAAAWLINQAVRIVCLRRSSVFEARAAWSLLSGDALWPLAAAGVVAIALTLIAAAVDAMPVALGCALAAVLLSRYLFFVTVVPLNMALTFVRSRPAGAHA